MTRRTAAPHRALCTAVTGILVALAWASPASAETKPLYELGAGVFLVSLPAYRGATEYKTYLLPFPYVVYRGRFLRSGRQGVRGVFYENPRAELSLSANASPPVSSHDVPIRAGMPDLKPSFEIGPELKLHLYRTPRMQVDFRLPVRAVQTLQLKPIGWVAYPHLNLDLPDWRDSGWNLGFSLGPSFGDRGYHRYFYDVAPQYATADRPVYRAPAGYSGATFYFAANRRMGQLWIGTYLRYDSLAGAAFQDSPLVRTRQYLCAGVGLAWVFSESSQRVTIRP
ncbi:MAG: MipA/OmpV family protein [Acidihalobacter sp.]|uniref:MipA/OmpV family protein n=1 Tax=Acidihalobacter sp. TaxID=1872108 RepID=UPI00307FACD9